MPDAAARPKANETAVWVERLTLTDFRNYSHLAHDFVATPVVLTGPNGAGKTNLLEAVSLLAPGQGLRRQPFAELTRVGADAGWSVAARVHSAGGGLVEIGTGVSVATSQRERSGRIVRIDRETQSGSGILAEHVELVWLTPAMDGLFTGPAGDRRRFLDRLIICFDPGYRRRVADFERAMRQRNRLLETGAGRAEFDGLELIMAETGVGIAAARVEAVAQLSAAIAERRQARPNSPFPWAEIALQGTLEEDVAGRPAIDVEDTYRLQLQASRDRDRLAKRTLNGPHRSDLMVGHGPKALPGKVCSTGEQKALLVGLVLAHAELVGPRRGRRAPLLLFDEIAAHLDHERRAALFDEIIMLGAQAWLTGTDRSGFSALEGRAQFFNVNNALLAE